MEMCMSAVGVAVGSDLVVWRVREESGWVQLYGCLDGGTGTGDGERGDGTISSSCEVIAFREAGDQADKLGRRVLEHGRTRYRSGRDRAGRGG